jgi:hypothetical protein
LPFHLAGQPFHRIQLSILNTLSVHHRTSVEPDVSFLRCCQGSHPAPYQERYEVCVVGGVSSRSKKRDSHPPAHQPKLSMAISFEIRILIAMTSKDDSEKPSKGNVPKRINVF